MAQDTILHILAAEKDAITAITNAKRQAKQIVAEAEEMVSQLRITTLEETRQQTDQMMLAARIEAEAERARIIAHAEGEAQHMETLAAYNFDEAVEFVLQQVAGYQ